LLEKFVNLIKSGEVIAFPTETVYGLGADAWNPDAVRKVFEIKGRPSDNPLIIHIADRKSVNDFALEVPAAAEKLMGRFWPGPLTLIFKKKTEVLDIITGGLSTVALRWPSHPISQNLIAQTGPLVAPSANTSGKPSPTKPEHVTEDFGEDFPVIPAGETQIGLESTVLDVSEEPFRIYRPGYIGKTQIEKVISNKVYFAESEGKSETRSPGTKYSHYAPDATVRWLKANENATKNNTLYLFHDKEPGIVSDHIIFYRGNYNKLAHELYDRFRQADLQGLDEVVIEPISKETQQENAIAKALSNRIAKAVGKN
jgi:L-threonylcarbamoyladenylate synthase